MILLRAQNLLILGLCLEQSIVRLLLTLRRQCTPNGQSVAMAITFRGCVAIVARQRLTSIRPYMGNTAPTAGQRWTKVMTIPACKACGEWFAKTNPHEELCFKCECALCRLSSYVVHVTRCKDCAHYDLGVCLKIYSDGNAQKDSWYSRNPDDFCSYGERKGNNPGLFTMEAK